MSDEADEDASEDTPDIEVESASDAEYIDLPNGGSFVFPRGASWAADELGACCFCVWPNGNLSYLVVPDEGNPRWKVVEHKRQGLEVVPK